MTVEIIILLVFAVIIVIGAIFYKNSTLDKLEFLPNETIISEVKKIRVEHINKTRTTIFLNCIIRITNKRIIIAQKILFSDKFALRYIISYTENIEKNDFKKSMKQGYSILTITKTSINLTIENEICSVEIIVPNFGIFGNSKILFNTDKYMELQKIFE